MTQPFDAETPVARTHDPREALHALSALLLSHASSPLSHEAVDDAVDDVLRRQGPPRPASWPHVLDDLARPHGRRVAWRVAPWEQIEEEVQPSLPAVTWTPQGWVVVVRRGARLLVSTLPGGDTPKPLRADMLPAQPITWALVEDALPGSMFGGDPDLSPMRRLAGLLRAEREDLTLVLIYAAAAGALGLAIPVAVQVLVNTVAFGAFRQPLIALSFMLLTCLAVAALLRGLQRYVIETLQRRVFVRMVADLSERLPRVELKAWDNTHGPELVNRFFDVLTVQKSMSSLLLDGLSASLQALVGMVLLALYHPALLGFDVVLIISIVGLVWILGRGAQKTAVVESKRKYAVAGWLEEIAAHPTLYKLGGGSELAVRRADVLSRRWLEARADHFRIFFRQYGGALALQAVANAALLTIGGWLVLESQLTIGQLVAAEFIVASVLIGFAKFSEKLETFYDLLAAVDKLGTLVDLPIERAHGWRAEPPTSAVALSVEGLQGSWSHGRAAFQDVSFQAAAGEHVAIVGDDGSGRATLADLILGLRLPPKGRILLDGVDLREMRLDSLRERVALVRGLEVVSGTVGDNIGMGRPWVDPRDIRAAINQVGLTASVESLDKGLDTQLLAQGAPLTEGERARLAVARAIVGKPRLIVVDRLLDVVGHADRQELLRVLTQPGAPWTLVVLTRDPVLARTFGRALHLVQGRILPLSA